ncbi:GNAT family N-acetyltransferase [Rhizobium sp. KVB221]|uniref:GNAT family N-acetyltransferase n=1 Tax=Rhizobium setariae TaxID=2801340 RepID=A0A936YNZ9_9HYPH|nr:GNAT family N-acetyltransferase [Rhizobium setariae]MBL0371614.1 GNAT family N-acetyltransferase [Rhizobium setariae]
MANTQSLTIERFPARDIETHLTELAGLLQACVEDGASVNFVLPYTLEEAKAFWRSKVLPRLPDGGLVVLVARSEGRIAGSVQLDHDTPPNQPHRADIKKLLVHPDFQRRGIGRKLMGEIERVAVEMGRTLLTLDTRTGDKGEPLYKSCGFEVAGIIPGYSRDARSDHYDPATFMYKALRAG